MGIRLGSYEVDKWGSRWIPRISIPRTRPGVEEIVLSNHEEANEVLIRLRTLVCRQGYATVSDFYDLVRVSGHFLDHKSGWVSLRGAHVARVHDGFLLKLPKTTCLEGV